MSIARRYWRFVLFAAVFALTGSVLLILGVGAVPALLLGFDVATIVFIAALVMSVGNDDDTQMRRHAKETEPDHHILQVIAAVIVAMVVVAVGYEVGGGDRLALALASATLFLAWLFGNTLFALHYAYAFYLGKEGGGDCQGLDFPGGEKSPDYWDFAYFSFVIGTAFAVSDIRVSSKRLRRVILLQSTVSFWFNIGVVALTISFVGDALT